MINCNRLTEINRIRIESGIISRQSIRAIAASIDKSASTISREVRRNGGCFRYYAGRAHQRSKLSNKKGYSKIEASPDLKAYIIEKVQQKWAPGVIAGRWNLNDSKPNISTEAIYAWIYSDHAKTLKLYEHLPRRKRKRGQRKTRPERRPQNKASVHDRPQHINDRIEIGHQEMDLVFQQGNGSQNILTCVDRKSRYVQMIKNNSKHAHVVAQAINKIRSSNAVPIKSITFDNGSEFANHKELGTDTYFCDPGCPWQKGSIENFNGILRRHLDYRVPAEDITQETIDQIAHHINNIPRKILGFLTPLEVLKNSYRQKSDCVAFYF